MRLREKAAVLIVDDEEPIRKLITTLLSIKGYHIRSASSAQEALEIMAEEPFDALLTDYKMPGDTGLDLILEVNRLYPETVRILLTGVGDRDLYREAINRGAIFSLIEKPFRNQHLLEILEKALDFRFSRLHDRQEILRLKEQYHAVFHNTADLIQCTDTQGGFIYVNPAWHHVLGYSEDDLPQISLFELAFPDHGNRLRNIIRQAGEGKRVKTFETVLAAKDGSPVYLEGNATAQVQDSGVVSVTCIFRDVTERKLITAELRARLQQETMIARIAYLLARAEEPASVYDSILEIVAKSAGADAVFIYSLNEVDQVFTMVESWSSSSGSQFPQRFRTISYDDLPWCHERITAGNTLRFDTVSEMPEPDQHFFERSGIGSFLAFPIHIGTCVVGVLGFNVLRRTRVWEEHEIAMLKAAADIIANAWTRQMEINVRRQKEIEAEQSRRLVIRADRLAALGTMAAGIIHEITQPLNAINVSTQTILYGLARGWKIEEEKVTGSLNLIVDQVKRMTDIITNMRAFARDGLPTAREVDSLNTQVKRVFTMLGEQMRAHNIDVVFRLGDIPDIRMNTQQILQVVLNLVTNARQALDEIERPDKTIIISTFVEDNCAVLEVVDNGPGVPEHIKEKIFDPFFTTKEVGTGTGLGLSISTGIVHDHHGEMDVRNNETGGAAFVVRLPLTQ
ncbi:MAG: response regulator [Candidatus Latescibacterota bacterium]